MRQIHTIPPFYNENSEILILGSFPSVKSRETQFFYGHPQNRFWKVLSAVYNKPVPISIEEKKIFLSSLGIAVWDVINSCDIEGSSDASIKNILPNDIGYIINHSGIKRIYTNGSTAYKLYCKHIEPNLKIKAIPLPSTSPANAGYSLEKLILVWKDNIL